jgi:hypothetical protein
MNNKEKISTLRQSLPYGAIKLISERTGAHRDTVARVLSGKSYRKDVIKEALKIIKERSSLIQKVERVTA